MSVDLLGPRLAPALAGLAADGREPGAAACLVTPGGTWSATVGDDGRGSAWRDDTLAMTYSCAKPLTALTVLSVVAEGRLALDQPVADVWPEYAVHGKGRTTVADVLAHRAGQPAFPREAAATAFDDRDALVAMLAAAPPQLPPGGASAEHALTYGHLCDELVRRATGEPLDRRWARIAADAGWDLHLSVGDADLARVADVELADPAWAETYLADERWGPVLSRPAGLLDPAVVNSRWFRQHCFGAVSLHASAVGLARFYADLIDDAGAVASRLGPALHRASLTPQVVGLDAVIGRQVAWTLGLQHDVAPDGSVEVGMGGVGGCAGWGRRGPDGAPAYAFAYVSRGLGGGVLDELATILEETWPLEG